MNITLTPDLQKLVQNRVASGQYLTAGDVIAAAIVALEQQEAFGEFEVGELDQLLAEGERSIEQEGTLDGGEAFKLRCESRAAKRRPS